MTRGRRRELVEAMVASLRDMSDPFSHDFLVEHNVTADEIFQLSHLTADALEMFT